MFWESKRLEDIDFLLNWQEFWRRSLNSYLEYGELVSVARSSKTGKSYLDICFPYF